MDHRSEERACSRGQAGGEREDGSFIRHKPTTPLSPWERGRGRGWRITDAITSSTHTGERESRIQDPLELAYNGINIGVYQLRGESNHSQAAVLHPGIAGGVAILALFMHRAIDFDNERRGVTVKIRDEWAERMLSAKLEAAELLAAENVPEFGFDRSKIATQFFRTLHRFA
jgi:hypothetical protein